jgi:hypothetical protein
MRQRSRHRPADLDGAGRHSSQKVIVPGNIGATAAAALLAGAELRREHLGVSPWQRALSNRAWNTYGAILNAYCDAWNAQLAKSNVITSIGTRE